MAAVYWFVCILFVLGMWTNVRIITGHPPKVHEDEVEKAYATGRLVVGFGTVCWLLWEVGVL